MTYWTLTESDIDRIAIGVGILGTGGGGSPYLQMLIAKQMLREGKRIRMIRPRDLTDDAQIIGLGSIGAPTVSIEKIAYLSLDMNIAAPERAALEHFWPKLVSGGVIVLDDYGWAAHVEQKATIDEFAAARGIQVCCLPTGQGLIIKP